MGKKEEKRKDGEVEGRRLNRDGDGEGEGGRVDKGEQKWMQWLYR